MGSRIILPEDLAAQIAHILSEVHSRVQVDCVLLADVSGQLIEVQGEAERLDPVLVAALAAGELAAMSELARQIGDRTPHGSFLHEGEERCLYISSVSGTFILIVVFSADAPVGLVRLFVRRAVERLHPLTTDFEELMGKSRQLLEADFGSVLSGALDKAFEGL